MEYLKERLSYDPETGVFRWLRSTWTRPDLVGAVAGTVNKLGYCIIKIDGNLYKAHRLAWFYMTGAWPSGFVDHTKGDTSDNRWAKLRVATPLESAANCKIRADNTSGFKGVGRKRVAGRVRYVARIRRDRVRHHLGYFDTPEEAHAAYCRAALDLHGEFARLA